MKFMKNIWYFIMRMKKENCIYHDDYLGDSGCVIKGSMRICKDICKSYKRKFPKYSLK